MMQSGRRTRVAEPDPSSFDAGRKGWRPAYRDTAAGSARADCLRATRPRSDRSLKECAMSNLAPPVLQPKLLRILHRAFVQARNLALWGDGKELYELADTFEILPELMAHWDET